MQRKAEPIKSFNKTINIPPDKSISHRAVMLGALACGESTVRNALLSEDILSTIDCMQKLGADISRENGMIKIRGIKDFISTELYAGNSGTTMRLLTGVLAAQKGGVFSFLGDESLSKRPMKRVSEPLSLMGADIVTCGGCAPLLINGRKLKGIDYQMPVDSAQVKSAVLLAGLFAGGETLVRENVKSRDHTEIMLKTMGAHIKTDGLSVSIKKSVLKPVDITVPGDISSAAFPLVLAAVKNGAYLKAQNVGINPTRTGILKVFDMAGVDYTLSNFSQSGEMTADIEVRGGKKLKCFEIEKELVPSLVDEIPVIAVLACFCAGTTVISGAAELKVKESNRIDTVAAMLKMMGADVETKSDGLIIKGKGGLKGGALIETRKDHRIAMSAAIAGALSENGAEIIDAECVDVSYPAFFEQLGL